MSDLNSALKDAIQSCMNDADSVDKMGSHVESSVELYNTQDNKTNNKVKEYHVDEQHRNQLIIDTIEEKFYNLDTIIKAVKVLDIICIIYVVLIGFVAVGFVFEMFNVNLTVVIAVCLVAVILAYVTVALKEYLAKCNRKLAHWNGRTMEEVLLDSVCIYWNRVDANYSHNYVESIMSFDNIISMTYNKEYRTLFIKGYAGGYEWEDTDRAELVDTFQAEPSMREDTFVIVSYFDNFDDLIYELELRSGKQVRTIHHELVN